MSDTMNVTDPSVLHFSCTHVARGEICSRMCVGPCLVSLASTDVSRKAALARVGPCLRLGQQGDRDKERTPLTGVFGGNQVERHLRHAGGEAACTVTLCIQPVNLWIQPATLRIQPATLCTQPATLCIQPATLCTQPATLCRAAPAPRRGRGGPCRRRLA